MQHRSKFCGSQDRRVYYKQVKNYLSNQIGYVVDVRTRKEVKETGLISNAVNIPLNELQDALNMHHEDFKCKYNREKPQRETRIIFNCNGGYRSSEAVRLALAMGYDEPYNYVGGWQDWEAHERGERADNN